MHIHIPCASEARTTRRIDVLHAHTTDNTAFVGCTIMCWSVLQCVAVYGSVLQCVTVCCSMLQCVAVRCSMLLCFVESCSVLKKSEPCAPTTTHCNTLHYNATHISHAPHTLWEVQYLACALPPATLWHYNTLYHTATNCNTLQLVSTWESPRWAEIFSESVCCSALHCVAVCCSVLLRIAVICSVLQRVAACLDCRVSSANTPSFGMAGYFGTKNLS